MVSERDDDLKGRVTTLEVEGSMLRARCARLETRAAALEEDTLARPKLSVKEALSAVLIGLAFAAWLLR